MLPPTQLDNCKLTLVFLGVEKMRLASLVSMWTLGLPASQDKEIKTFGV